MCSTNTNSCTTKPDHDCGCSCSCGCAGQFLSKKKRLEHLNKYRECLQEKISDIDEYIKEISE